MSRTLKTFHYISLGLGFLSLVALFFNIYFFSRYYPVATQFLELDPSLESLGVVAALNIITIALFHLVCVLTLLVHLVKQKQISPLVITTIALGIISGIMNLGDVALLSDIGKEYPLGWETQGEWTILFLSYGLHAITLILALISLNLNLKKDHGPADQVIKDEVLFLSLLSTGLISGVLGLLGVFSAFFFPLKAWIMSRVIPVIGSIILSPFLITLVIWLFRKYLGAGQPELDEKQSGDLARASLNTLSLIIPSLILYFGFQISGTLSDSLQLLWLPLLVFGALSLLSGFSLRYFQS
jgi:hypothetical protein